MRRYALRGEKEKQVNFIAAYQCSKCTRFFKDKEGTEPIKGNVALHKGQIVCQKCCAKQKGDTNE